MAPHVTSPRVSVIMSVLNGQPYLRAAMDGVLGQELRDLEFIVIDDGSTDGTWEELEDYARQDPRVVLVRNHTNEGYTLSLNKGLLQARGEFVARQDADDVSLPGRLQAQVRVMEDAPGVGLVGIIPSFIDENGDGLRSSDPSIPITNEAIQARLLDRNCIWHGSVMFRRALLDIVGSYDPRLEPSEDYDLWLRLAEVTEIANVGDPLYLYRQHRGSESYKRRWIQMRHKAAALENALNRRYQAARPKVLQSLLARDYFRAYVLAEAAGKPGAADCLSRALVASSDGQLEPAVVEAVIRTYVPQGIESDQMTYLSKVFEPVLAHAPELAHLKARLEGELGGARRLPRQSWAATVLRGLRVRWPVRRGAGTD